MLSCPPTGTEFLGLNPLIDNAIIYSMRIAYEGSTFHMMPLGGITRYFHELISRLDTQNHPCVLLPNGYNLPPLHPNLKTATVPIDFPLNHKTTQRLFARYWRRWRWPKNEQALSDFNADLHHWTYHCGLCFRPIHRGLVPNVITVYDFIFEDYPEFDPRGKHREWLKNAIQSADLILCISEYTHNQLCDRYPTASQKSVITPLGNSFSEVTSSTLPSQLVDRPFLLSVGKRTGYKNFVTLWKAWKQVRQHDKELMLVAVGPEMTESEAKSLGISADEKGFLSLGSVSDEILKSLYEHCQAFVFPTRMEGFGLPAVEAMESGCVVLASDCGALKEVCGDAAYHFSPNDIDSLTELVKMAIHLAPTDREKAIARGKQRASDFSWDQNAKQTTAAYRKLIQ